MAGGVGGALRRLDAGVVQGEGPGGARGQCRRQGRPRDAGRLPVDAEDPRPPSIAFWLPRCAADGVRHPRRRQGSLAARPVRGGGQVSVHHHLHHNGVGK